MVVDTGCRTNSGIGTTLLSVVKLFHEEDPTCKRGESWALQLATSTLAEEIHDL